ncbi:Protein TPX2 [Raphanus sativus]|nr:Protein TPX2 [Raphanus sativus]
MDTTKEEQTACSLTTTMIDETYEFTAPRWYDFENEEMKLDKQRSELCKARFAASIPSIKARSSSCKVERMCNFSQVEEESTQLKAKGSSDEQVAADNKENIPPSQAEVSITTNTKTHLNSTKNRHVLMPIKQPQARGTNQKTIKRKIKPSKGKSLMVVNPDRAITLPHKTKKVYVPEQITPFVSTAELVNKFQPRPMTLTRLNEPEFATSQPTRPVRLKRTSELEEEMLAKMPKFKARPLNKKILEAPAYPAPQRSIPHPPEFKEFHLETMARARQDAETSSLVSTEMSKHNDWKRPHTNEPKSPLLQTMLRARPIKAKTSTEIEQEELKKVPKFRARPLNKKIFENERISQPNSVIDLFDKLSLNSESCRERPLQRNTTPNPFLLWTEERGAVKEKKFVRQVIDKPDKSVKRPELPEQPLIPTQLTIPCSHQNQSLSNAQK